MKLNIISALSLDGIIGTKNDLIWHIPEDLRNYKKNTVGKVLIVGRKTYDSLPKAALRYRIHIVLSNDISYNSVKQWEDKIVHSVHDAIKLAKEISPNDDVYIIGGSKIYELFIDKVDECHITWINKYLGNGDEFIKFPITELFNDFEIIEDTDWQSSQKPNLPIFKFTKYKRN